MQFRIIFTPEFRASVIIVSSPLTLVVALWGMTGERALQLMECSSVRAHALVKSLREPPSPQHSNYLDDSGRRSG